MKFAFYLDFTNFPWYIFPIPESHSGYHIIFSWQVSLDDSVLWQFLRLSLFMMTLTVLRNISWAFCRTSLYAGLSDVFLMGFGICGEEDLRVEGHSHHITLRAYTVNMIYHRGVHLNDLALLAFARLEMDYSSINSLIFAEATGKRFERSELKSGNRNSESWPSH